MSTRYIRKQIMSGIMLIVIGMALMHLMFDWRGNIPFKNNELFFLFIGFLSIVTIIFGGLVFGMGFGARFPLKAFLIAIAMVGVWIFLVELPIMVSSLPEEVIVLAISFSGLAFVLVFVGYEKFIAKRKRKHGEIEREEV